MTDIPPSESEATAPAPQAATSALEPPAVETGARTIQYRVAPDVVVMPNVEGGATAESIHALRTHLIAKHIREGRRGLAVCTTDRESGGVFVAVNLAVSLSQAGVRTLLIDSDMRAPEVHWHITPSEEVPSLRQWLSNDQMPISDAIQEEILPNLSVIFSGGRASDAQDLLAGPRFNQLVDLCLRNYEVTIVVTPPTSGCADARRVASVLRYAMVVARKDVTFVSEVNTLVSELTADGARVIGSVFNAV